MIGVLIVQLDALANLRGSDTNDGICICVVIRGAAKDFDAQDSLFELIRLTGQGVCDHELQETGIAFAGIKQGRSEQLFKLLLNGGLFEFAGRCPALRYLLY